MWPEHRLTRSKSANDQRVSTVPPVTTHAFAFPIAAAASLAKREVLYNRPNIVANNATVDRVTVSETPPAGHMLAIERCNHFDAGLRRLYECPAE